MCTYYIEAGDFCRFSNLYKNFLGFISAKLRAHTSVPTSNSSNKPSAFCYNFIREHCVLLSEYMGM